MTIFKSRILALLLVLAVLFTGCGTASESDASALQPQSEAAAPTQSNLPKNSLRILKVGTDQGRYRVVTTPQNYGSLICYLDFASGNEVPLCSSPNCKHLDDSCPAWLHDQNYILINALDDEHLILMVSDLAKKQTTLYLANADGSDRKILDERPCDYAFDYLYHTAFLADDEYLYYVVDEAAGAPVTEESIHGDPIDVELYRVSLNGSTPEKLCDLKRDSGQLTGVWGRNLVLDRFIPSDSDNHTGTITISLRSIDTGEEQTIFSIPNSSTTTDVFFNDGILYWIDPKQPETLFQGDLEGNQKQLMLDWNDFFSADSEVVFLNINALFKNHLIAQISTSSDSGDFAIDLTSGQTSPLTLLYTNGFGLEQPIKLLQTVGSDLLVEFAISSQQTTYWNSDGTPSQTDTSISRTGLISMDDYLAGRNNYREFNMMPLG